MISRLLNVPTLVFWVCILSACSKPTLDGAGGEQHGWPERSINIVVYSSAGGSTDLANRAIAEGMKATLNTEVTALNMPGALGGTAVNYVWNQGHDGYRLVGLSEGALGHSVLGLHSSTAKDWEYFMVGGTPGIISVNANSPYKTFQDLLDAVQKQPNEFTIATSVPGSVWNVQWLNTKRVGGFETRFVPYPGSFPSQTAALSGEVDIVWTGLGEQSEFLKSGNLRALAVFDETPVEFAGENIPPITDFLPDLKDVMPIKQFVGFAAPSDTPKKVLEKLNKAFQQGMKSAAVKQFSEAKYFSLIGLSGEEAKQVALTQEKTVAWTLWDAGIAKVNPAELGIETP